jgi:hypothetical protein
MTPVKARHLVFVGLIPVVFGACKKQETTQTDGLTIGEAQQAVEESALDGEAMNVTSGTIEIATSFTIGQAVENAATEIKTFIASQLPCADVTLSGATLTIEYGVNAGNCTYKGLTYTGTHTVSVKRNENSDVVVDHTWDGISNGRVSVSGTAEVTWSLANQSRHVTHELTWTRLKDGRTGTGSGDRTQTVLEGGIAEGIKVDGSRAWEGEAGRWDLAIENVEMRWIDPVPQAGAYRLATPSSKSISMSFSRVDDNTIQVTVESGGQSFHFNVTSLGSISS